MTYISAKTFSTLLPQLFVMCHGNRNDFHSAARANSCLGYLLDNKCYPSLVVFFTQIQSTAQETCIHSNYSDTTEAVWGVLTDQMI